MESTEINELFESLYASNQQIPAKTLTDDEYIAMQSNKELLASILLGILRYVPVRNFKDHDEYESILKKKLKFKHKDDYRLLKACTDLLEDTDSAIQEYKQYGLGNSGRISEKYLRLYGTLNSVYQQISVVIELVELFSYPGKKTLISQFKSLEVFKLRNRLAAHGVNYLVDSSKKASKENQDFSHLAQTSVSGWGERLLIVSNKTKPYKVDLKQLIRDYECLSDKVLYNTVEKAVHSIFPNSGEWKSWLLYRLQISQKRLLSED